MNSKSILLLLTLLFSYSESFLFAMAPPPPKNGSKAAPELDFSEEDMKMFTEFIDSLDQETIDALTAIGEEIIKEADELGIDPFEYIELQAQLQEEAETEAAKKPSTPLKVQEPTKEPTSPSSSSSILDNQDLLKNIIRLITVIREKAASNKDFSNQLIPFKYRLDDLVYYLTVAGHEKVIKYLGDKDFEPLLNNLKKLNTTLNVLEPQLHIAEFSLTGENPHEVLGLPKTATPDDIVQTYQQKISAVNPQAIEARMIRQGKNRKEIDKALALAKPQFTAINKAYTDLRNKEESHYIFEKILAAISEATDKDIILEDLRKLLKKYEPDALKIQQEREKIEADARKAQEEALKKRALPGRMVFSMPPPLPAPSTYEPEYSGYPGGDLFTPGFGGETVPSSAKGGGAGGTKAPKSAKEKKEKKEKKKKEGKEAKTEQEKKKAAEAGKEQKPTDPDVIEKLALVKDTFKKVRKELKKNKKELGMKFNEFITTPMAVPYDDNELAKIAKFQDILRNLTTHFEQLQSQIQSGLKKFKDKKEQLDTFKKAVAEEFKKFEDKNPKKKYQLIKYLLDFKEDKQVQPAIGADPVAPNRAKVFALTGVILPGPSLGFDDPANADAQKLKSKNPDQPQDVEKTDPITGEKKTVQENKPRNYIKGLHDAYKYAKEKIEDKDKKKPTLKKGI